MILPTIKDGSITYYSSVFSSNLSIFDSCFSYDAIYSSNVSLYNVFVISSFLSISNVSVLSATHSRPCSTCKYHPNIHTHLPSYFLCKNFLSSFISNINLISATNFLLAIVSLCPNTLATIFFLKLLYFC